MEMEDDEDFLSQVAAVEAEVLSTKRRKVSTTAITSSASTATAAANLSKALTTEEKKAAAEEEGIYTAALRGSRSLMFQQQSNNRSTGRTKGIVATEVFGNPEYGSGGGGGSTAAAGGGGGSCFKCGKSGHWARDCDSNITSYGSDRPVPPEKACPCGLGTCLVLTANTEKNRGRNFYKCPLRDENGGCGFFEWCDKNEGTNNLTLKSQSHAPNPSIPDLPCPCGAGSCQILTAKTEKNLGQMFYRCPAKQGSSCNFFKWCRDHTIADSRPASVNTSTVYKTNDVSNKSFGVRSGSSCFKCGKDGHWAKDCLQPNPKSC